eukprot:6214278-Pleurochrysis_carterae.AAC.2
MQQRSSTLAVPLQYLSRFCYVHSATKRRSVAANPGTAPARPPWLAWRGASAAPSPRGARGRHTTKRNSNKRGLKSGPRPGLAEPVCLPFDIGVFAREFSNS